MIHSAEGSRTYSTQGTICFILIDEINLSSVLADSNLRFEYFSEILDTEFHQEFQIFISLECAVGYVTIFSSDRVALKGVWAAWRPL